MRNIANVVHDLEAIIINHCIQAELLADKTISEEERKNLIASLHFEAKLFKEYIDSLKDEAIRNRLQKAKL